MGALVLVVLVIAGATAAAATPQTTLLDLEDEVMCPVCGTLLELAEAPQAQKQRAYIARLIAVGKTKEEVKDELVTQYGRGVLALPRGSGFSLSAYLVPIAGLVLAVGLLGFGVARWRAASGGGRYDGSREDGPQGEGAARTEDEDAARLDADIARYDL